ncbi:immunoglobulin lambda-1 light chain-like [Micropterus dolomieu]|uniref:immunoglobulin lambda-1 light chain-like n=1 Tax=Micropterus dolomieu TaxID=147949 RepID=UPI001E8E6BF8|nr:immunoglobulin lambda-1 light chain-like [Micropterus dolomieu]
MLTRGYKIDTALLETLAKCPLLAHASAATPAPQNTTVATDVKCERFHRGETHSEVHTAAQSAGQFPAVFSHHWDCTTECTEDNRIDCRTAYKPGADMLSHQVRDIPDLHWSSNKGYGIFGSGTKLYVTAEPVVKPVVSVYPAASRAHHEGKSSLLCVASNMFPPVVRFSWKRRKVNESLEEQAPAEEEQAPAEEVQLELRESGRTAAIRVIDRDALSTYKYRCYVQHEGGEVKAQTEQEVPEPADLAALQQADLSFQSQCRVKLLWLLYTVLIVKSLVYCCGLPLL